MNPVAIVISDLTVAYDGPEILRSVSLDVDHGEQVALLGPSGCGKTTLLRTLAGLERPASGTIMLDGTLVAGDGLHVPPEKRRIGLVFQDWALFPHLTVAQNVAYGLPRAERSRRGRPSARVEETLEMVGLTGLYDRAPHTLSGGQQQRVALARALAPQPDVLLLDEPFSNLDASLRTEIRTEVHRILAELAMTAVFVTHDQDEAFVLGDRVAVMREGSIVQRGTPAEVYSRPIDAWVATFVGEANLIPGSATAGAAATPVGLVPIDTTSVGSDAEGAVSVLIRPEELDLVPGQRDVIDLVEYYGHDTTYEVLVNRQHRIRVRQPSVPRFERGDAVQVTFIGRSSCVYPPAHEVRKMPSSDPLSSDLPSSDLLG